MRLSILPVLVAGAGMIGTYGPWAPGQVAAEPIRVIVDASGAHANIRFGHVLANANVNGNDDSTVARVRPAFVMAASTGLKGEGSAHHGCKNSIREGAIRISNAFRHALGLPLIEMDNHPAAPAAVIAGKPHHHALAGDEVHVMPIPLPPFGGVPEAFVHGHHAGMPVEAVADHPTDGHDGRDEHKEHRHHREHSHKHRKFRKIHCKKHIKGFFRRVHKALTALGPWEGRAVAFVLGCGLGVLLRMFWVLSVLAYRTIRGEREEVQGYIVLNQDVEPVFVAPPEYADEKRQVVEDDKRPIDA
ncbi:hypothetical protein ID866_6700 [Astraeus odoratus]|nr:hypothetical protein ID866_6700 [Astraeus odoratus]